MDTRVVNLYLQVYTTNTYCLLWVYGRRSKHTHSSRMWCMNAEICLSYSNAPTLLPCFLPSFPSTFCTRVTLDPRSADILCVPRQLLTTSQSNLSSLILQLRVKYKYSDRSPWVDNKRESAAWIYISIAFLQSTIENNIYISGYSMSRSPVPCAEAIPHTSSGDTSIDTSSTPLAAPFQHSFFSFFMSRGEGGGGKNNL